MDNPRELHPAAGAPSPRTGEPPPSTERSSGSDPRQRGSWWVALAAVLTTAAVLGACSEQLFDPFANDDRYFTVYGFLDVQETDHAIRVIPITRRQATIQSPADIQADIDAVVTSTEVATGIETRWRHSLDTLSDGTYAHIFRASFLPTAGRTYELRIERSDGVTTTARTTVPIVMNAPILTRSGLLFSADSTVITEVITARDMPSPWGIEIYYFVSGGLFDAEFEKPYGRVGERLDDGSWRFTLEHTVDKPWIDDRIQEIKDLGLIDDDDAVLLTGIGVRYRILDSEWNPPDGVFDFETLAQPGVLSNVENGYGLFGSIGEYLEFWDTTELSPILGFD